MNPVRESGLSAKIRAEGGLADLCASASTRRASSSLYSPACRLVYLDLASLFAGGKKEPPPCLLKNSAIEAFPPTFSVRSWGKDQVSRFVELDGISVSLPFVAAG